MKNNDFKPYVSADSNPPELTVTSIVTGVILAVVFGAANAYLGLRVGMTVSASIPAAVVSMGVIRVILRKKSILENNIVQTIGSAGESIAAGTIFTLPALFLWASEGKIEKPDVITITWIAVIGGLLGVFFMVPLRNALIVKEHKTLPYPEGTACAEVLLAGEEDNTNSSVVFIGMGLGALFKFIIDGFKLVAGEISFRVKGFAGEIGTQIYPAVMSVGYICGPKIASYMFSGGIFSWLVIIPVIVFFGENSVLYPGTETIGSIYSSGGASAIWSSYIRYIGAGALAAGGVISLIKSLPLIVKTFSGAMRNAFSTKPETLSRVSNDISIKVVITSIAILTILVWVIPAIPVNFVSAAIIVVFGFFFATVSSRMVGIVGSSNNPVSGMAIATLIITALILKSIGATGADGMTGAIAIGSIICIISAIAGDTSQDLKTGYILGATPKKQQIGEIIGAVSASVAISWTLYLLDAAWGFGSEELGAPQATLMKLIIEGVMGGNLPWILVVIGVFISIVIEILGIPVLPFAIGVYLPVHLNTCIMVGGLIRLILEKLKRKEDEKNEIISRGVLCCSGMIAGEGIAGIMLALLAVLGINSLFQSNFPTIVYEVGGIALFGVIIASVFVLALKKRKE